jgi:hypothetical protein
MKPPGLGNKLGNQSSEHGKLSFQELFDMYGIMLYPKEVQIEGKLYYQWTDKNGKIQQSTTRPAHWCIKDNLGFPEFQQRMIMDRLSNVTNNEGKQQQAVRNAGSVCEHIKHI